MENQEKEVNELSIKDFPMEKAMMSDMVALSAVEAILAHPTFAQSLEKPMSQIVAIGFAFAKEFLRQREDWLKPKEETEVPKPSVIQTL